jgi:hypothetical protein
VLSAAILLVVAIAPPPPRLVASTDVPGLRAEVFAATATARGTRIEIRLVNETSAAIDVSRLLDDRRSPRRGGVSGIRLWAEPGRTPLPMLDARGEPHAPEVLPRWHLDLEIEFAPAAPGTRAVTVAVPHFPLFAHVPLRQ